MSLQAEERETENTVWKQRLVGKSWSRNNDGGSWSEHLQVKEHLQAKEHQGLSRSPDLRQKHGTDSHIEPQQGVHPADTMISPMASRTVRVYIPLKSPNVRFSVNAAQGNETSLSSLSASVTTESLIYKSHGKVLGSTGLESRPKVDQHFWELEPW